MAAHDPNNSRNKLSRVSLLYYFVTNAPEYETAGVVFNRAFDEHPAAEQESNLSLRV